MDERADQRSDADLVAAANRGDWTAFDALYYRYRDWTFRLAWRFAGSEADAQDAVQEVFVYLAGKLRAGLQLRAGLTSLLYPAVKHSALAMKRKRARFQDVPENDDFTAPPRTPAIEGIRRELSDVLQSLSDAHREVLLMRFVDDMTLDEIAFALTIPVGTAKSRLHHALAGLRDDPTLRRYFEEK